MSELDRYLDLYRIGDAVQRAVPSMRVGPETGFFNPPFPLMRSGLDGLRAVGEPLGRPPAATMTDGYVAPPVLWLQKALNALSVLRGQPATLAVDGVAGQATLAAVSDVSRSLNRAWAPPYLVTVEGQRTVAMKRDVLIWLVAKNLVEVAPPLPAEAPPVITPEAPPLPPTPPPAGGGGGGALFLIAAAVVAGLYFARR